MTRKTAKPPVRPDQGVLVIEQPTEHVMAVEVTGDSTYIQNNFGQKVVEEMLRKHMGHNVQREPKRPRELLERAAIKNTDGRVCVPPICFKHAMVSAASLIKGLKKTVLRTALFVEGQSIPITYERMEPLMSIVRLAGFGRTPDIRFRPSYVNWKARLVIRFPDIITHQSVLDLLNRAGRSGVGEWRPQKNGTAGTFHVSRAIESQQELDEIRAECSVPLVPLVIPAWAMDMEIDPAVLSKMFEQAGAEQPPGQAASADETDTADEEEAAS